MTYWLLNLGFTLVAATVAASYILSVRRRGGRTIKSWGIAVAVTLVLLCVLTAVFDNLMIAAGFFSYSSEQISGWRIGAAPVEDFLYVLAAALLLPALWQLMAAKPGSRRRE
ncbi:lycopene cyclase domain-containing protein [Arthrobacter monumenti]